MMPALMGKDRIIDNPSRMQRKPWIDPLFVMPRGIIISKIIMAVPGTEKECVIKYVQIDHKTG